MKEASMKAVHAIVILSGVFIALPVSATVHGTVVTPDSIPVEGARVELADGSAFRITDAHGAFHFDELDPPVALRVAHPRFQLLEAECCAEGGSPLVLLPKQEAYGEIVVTANREGSGGIQPISVATSSITVRDRPAPVPSVVELAEGMPGVAENGQGGLSQAYSIRGTGGQRVMTLVAGTRIVAERRAGATASFIDPLLLGTVNVVRGPYSSYYGSGALGGVLEAVPRAFQATTAELGWESQGDANYQMVGLDLEGWSLGLARRASNASETPDGLFLPSQFEQYSATVDKLWTLSSGLELDLLLALSRGDDIGKPNRRYPARVTTYPEEQHLVGRVAIRRPGVWHLDLYAHPNTLDTENTRSSERSLVENQAIDFGFNLQREFTLPASFAARAGLDYFGRQGVQATETITNLSNGTTDEVTTLDGCETDLAAYGSVRRSFGAVAAEVGGRLNWIGQANTGAATTDDTAATGFLGLSVPAGSGFELVANVGTGYRFPGLSERYFSGSTGRGEIVANEDLDPERSLTTDAGLRFFGRRLFAAAYLYRTAIDSYIERVELEPGVQTFVNLTSGTIDGIEVEGFYQATEGLRLELAGQATESEADDGSPLAEAPSNRFTLGGTFARDAWSAALRWQHRFDKDDPGPGEEAIDGADIVSASLRYALRNGLAVTLFGNNLLDETYLPTADELAAPAAGRSVGVGISWGG
jgi:iron complex outermembrane receptor protein